MFLLTAVFKRHCLADVLLDLKERKIQGVTVSSVIGKGAYGIVDSTIDMDENVRLDIVISNETFKESAKEAIRANTRDLGPGSGKMWVTPVLEVERIRTGETGEAALRQTGSDSRHSIHDYFFTEIDTPVS